MRLERVRLVLATAGILVLAGGLAGLRLLTAPRESAAAAPPQAAEAAAPQAAAAAASVLRLRARVRSVLPHDPEAFTQGLLWHEGKLYESTGQYGSSSLRRIDPTSGKVEKSVELAPELFGEGLALVGDRLMQLTWRAGVAIAYDVASLEEVERFEYPGQGWGLCFDGRRLVMSDGSDTLVRRDPETFGQLDRLKVTFEERPVANLNELECVEGWIYANVWQSEAIIRIDPVTGVVRAVVDASGLLSAEERAGVGVLNGIAYDSRNATFLLTGKLWPKLFEVVFVESG